MINIGFDNRIDRNKIVAIVKYGSAPICRMVIRAKDEGNVIDCTGGRKTASVIVMDNKILMLSYIKTADIKSKMGRRWSTNGKN